MRKLTGLVPLLLGLAVSSCNDPGSPGGGSEQQNRNSPAFTIEMKVDEILALNGQETEPLIRELTLILSEIGQRYGFESIGQALDQKFEISCHRKCEVKLREN